MRRTEIISAVAIVAFGIFLMSYVIPNYVSGRSQRVDLSPAFMPYVAAAIMTGVMAIFLILKLVKRSPDDDLPTPLPRESWLYIGIAIAIFAATWLASVTIDFVAGGVVVVGGFMALARAKPIVVAGSAIVFPIAVWLFIDKLMGIPLP